MLYMKAVMKVKDLITRKKTFCSFFLYLHAMTDVN